MIALVDRYLNNATMYRVFVHVLAVISGMAVALSGLGLLPFSFWWLCASFVVIVAACAASNAAFARLVGAAANVESWLITALLLFLILFPARSWNDLWFLAFAAVAAIGSKYVLTRHNRHVFNPAALGAFVVGLLGYGSAWWVASPVMLPFVAVGAFLALRKVRRWPLFGVYAVAVLIGRLAFALGDGTVDLVGLAWDTAASWPIVFFGAFMLTEPLTLPADRDWQWTEAAAVGLLSVIPFQFGWVTSTPELALLAGNALSAAVSPKRLLRLTLAKKTELAPGLWDFAFSADVRPRFEAGQYLEWTLPHEKPDARGNRRTFTVASSPSESLVHLGARVPAQNPSSYKRALAALSVGDVVFGSNVLGDFTLPAASNVPIAWIAGGIGVTPFRSMAQDMVETQTHRDVVLFYACNSPADFAYEESFHLAAPYGVRLARVATGKDTPADWGGYCGLITADMVRKEAPNYASRLWYLSGPPMMVNAYRTLLASMGVPKRQIRTDYFPGY